MELVTGRLHRDKFMRPVMGTATSIPVPLEGAQNELFLSSSIKHSSA